MIVNFEVCDCDCHKSGKTAMCHIPCCEPCPGCGENIRPVFTEQHRGKCERLRSRIEQETGSVTKGYAIETEREDDGRWSAEVEKLPRATAYGRTEAEAIQNATAIADLVNLQRR
jgi:hypothetical protein